ASVLSTPSFPSNAQRAPFCLPPDLLSPEISAVASVRSYPYDLSASLRRLRRGTRQSASRRLRTFPEGNCTPIVQAQPLFLPCPEEDFSGSVLITPELP